LSDFNDSGYYRKSITRVVGVIDNQFHLTLGVSDICQEKIAYLSFIVLTAEVKAGSTHVT
jgi:hypothetical protein